MSNGSKQENDIIIQQDENELQNSDDWLAIKTNKYKTNELINIVSLSIEMEKISIVTREHNRLSSDDINTKQWYGIYSVEQLYLIHQHFCQIDFDLDKYFPDQLRPIKGYLSTYFNNDLSKTVCNENTDKQVIDLQDNFLCNSISDYLKKCIQIIGVNLFVDILFNDLNSSDYFEIYSEFNLKRLQNDIDKEKELFNKIRNGEDKKKSIQKIDLNNEDYIWEFKRNLRNILHCYMQEDGLLNRILLLYAEYYNNLLKPLIDSNELAKKKLVKYEKKLASQQKTIKFLSGQSNIDALKELEEMVRTTEEEVFELSNDIDNLCIQYKQNIINLYNSIQDNIKRDKLQFYLPKNNPYYSFFESIVSERFSRNENEITEKNIQIFKIQLGFIERKLDNLTENQNNSTDTRSLKIKMLNQKLKIHNNEEILLKKSLNEIRNENKDNVSNEVYNLARDLGPQYLDELKEKFKIDINKFLIEKKEEIACIVESSESEDDYLSEKTKFFDTYETTDKLNEEVNREKNEKTKKINEIKKKMLTIGSKKSSLRLALKKLEETGNVDEKAEQPEETTLKTLAIKKEEDKIQKKLCMENRNKALQRLKDYKMNKMKDPNKGSSNSLSPLSKISENENSIKKPYVPKSKQRILPPNSLNQKLKIFKKEETGQLENFKNENISNQHLPISTAPPPPPLPPFDFVLNNSKNSSQICPPPSIPPSFTKESEPTRNISNAPLPPPPPPIELLSHSLNLPSKPNVEKNQNLDSKKIEPKEITNIEFDINEIKNFKFKKSAKSPPKKENTKINQFNSWETLMNEIRNNGGRKLKNITNESKNRKTKCDLDLPHKSKLEMDLTSILSERSKFFNLDEEEGSDSDASWDN